MNIKKTDKNVHLNNNETDYKETNLEIERTCNYIRIIISDNGKINAEITNCHNKYIRSFHKARSKRGT